MAKKKQKKKPNAPSFEESLESLRQTVSELENGNLTLSESLEKYELGIASLKQAYDALNAAQQRIEMLVDLDEEGNLVTRPFDNTASEEITVGSRRASDSSSAQNEPADGPDEDDEDSGGDIEDIEGKHSLF